MRSSIWFGFCSRGPRKPLPVCPLCATIVLPPSCIATEREYARPLYLDSLAADFPGLAIIGAHPSWPWHEEMIASMQHKANVFNDLSAWVPKRMAETLLR